MRCTSGKLKREEEIRHISKNEISRGGSSTSREFGSVVRPVLVSLFFSFMSESLLVQAHRQTDYICARRKNTTGGEGIKCLLLLRQVVCCSVYWSRGCISFLRVMSKLDDRPDPHPDCCRSTEREREKTERIVARQRQGHSLSSFWSLTASVVVYSDTAVSDSMFERFVIDYEHCLCLN